MPAASLTIATEVPPERALLDLRAHHRRIQITHGAVAVLMSWSLSATLGPMAVVLENRRVGATVGLFAIPIVGPIISPFAAHGDGYGAAPLHWAVAIGSTAIQIASWIVLLDALLREIVPPAGASFLRADGMGIAF